MSEDEMKAGGNQTMTRSDEQQQARNHLQDHNENFSGNFYCFYVAL